MKDIIIIVLIILFVVAILYLCLLKRGIRNLKQQLSEKVETNSNVVLTTESIDKDLCQLVQSINYNLKVMINTKIYYENKNNNLQKMMVNISHDLRTPLTSALGYIDLCLNSNNRDEKDNKELLIIEERLKRLSELIDSFFEFSKIISDSVSIDREEMNLIAVIEKNISNHYEDFSKDDRSICLEKDNRVIVVNSNEAMLSRVFDNLIRNAYKHSKSDLNIVVTSSKTIKIIFENHLNYKDLDINRIFDEFYTVDISRTKGNTGLGLAIAKEFTNQLNGVIRAEKKEDKLLIILEF